MQLKVSELRSKAARGEMTLEDTRQAVQYLRELRGKARPATQSVAKGAATPLFSTGDLLKGLK